MKRYQLLFSLSFVFGFYAEASAGRIATLRTQGAKRIAIRAKAGRTYKTIGWKAEKKQITTLVDKVNGRTSLTSADKAFLKKTKPSALASTLWFVFTRPPHNISDVDLVNMTAKMNLSGTSDADLQHLLPPQREIWVPKRFSIVLEAFDVLADELDADVEPMDHLDRDHHLTADDAELVIRDI